MQRIRAVCLAGALVASTAGAAPITGVPTPNPKSIGHAPANRLSPELREVPVVQGSTAVENPAGIVTHYGYENDTPSADNPAVPQMVPVGTPAVEAQKTEPDKNTYLVLHGQRGADSHYDYGTHFLFQGHEVGAPVAGGNQGYITRINLDADSAHRVTVMATADVNGKPIAPIDGSTWDPFARRLLFTTESASAPTYAATVDYPSQVEDVSGALGRGGYEGIQNDGAGNIWIVEDIGGAAKPGTTAKRPNSFVYRYVPRQPGDLHHGRLQVLQVLNESGAPITFESQAALNSPDQIALHTYGKQFRTRWVTVHDTEVDGSTPFSANASAKAQQGTPFKRPENGVFRPGTEFREFFFDETGDTNATSAENPIGGWTSLFRLQQRAPSADEGQLSLFFTSKSATVAGLDNIQFLSRHQLLVVEDAGDTLHGQRNALDSGWLFDTRVDYGSGQMPIRFLAEGRDAAATLDSGNGGFGKNEGDNEITGIHVSDGDASRHGILGASVPRFGHDGWRMFFTQQHGENITYEIVPAREHDRDDHCDRDDDR